MSSFMPGDCGGLLASEQSQGGKNCCPSSPSFGTLLGVFCKDSTRTELLIATVLAMFLAANMAGCLCRQVVVTTLNG